MLDNYLIVSKEVLPEIFEKVIKVKQMMSCGEFDQVSEAVKKVGLSRSTYYKYKDHVFIPTESSLERKALISFVLSDEKGLLSEVLNLVSNNGCNILTINQNIPINGKASVIISVDVREMNVEIEELISMISRIKKVSKASLISIE